MTLGGSVSSARELEDLSRAGHGPDDFMAYAAEILHRSVPFDGLCMGLTDPSTNLLVSSKKFDLGEIGDTDFLYWEYTEPDVAHFQELAKREGGVSVLEQETGGDKNASGRFREVIRPQIGADHELRGVTRVGGLMWGVYAMYRSSGASAFNAAEVDFLQRLEPVLAAGIRASTITAVAAETLRDPAPGPAVLVFDSTGQLLHATSTAAERLSDLGGGLEVELPVPVSAVVAAIQGPRIEAPEARRAAAQLQHRPSAVPATSANARARGASGRWYALHAAPFAAGDGTQPQIAVTIETATPPQILPLLTAAYDLSGREAKIVQAVLRGETTQEIGRALFLSPHTVQDHFKSIFEKLGVSSRREVAARVFYDQYLSQLPPSDKVPARSRP